MQDEFNAENPDLQIQILGINQAGYSSGNSTISNGRDIPWLQDTVEENVWYTWEHAYRDVIIVDEDNQRVGVYNLSPPQRPWNQCEFPDPQKHDSSGSSGLIFAAGWFGK